MSNSFKIGCKDSKKNEVHKFVDHNFVNFYVFLLKLQKISTNSDPAEPPDFLFLLSQFVVILAPAVANVVFFYVILQLFLVKVKK